MTGARMAFVAITVLAAGVRLWHLDLISFGHDEAGLAILAEDMVRLGKVPLNGPISSVGLSTPAHFIYLIAPLIAVSRDPTFIAGFLALLGTAGVAISMTLGWRAFGPLVGLVAGLLFAVNPVAVAYSRRIWQPDVMPMLAALVFLALDVAVFDRRHWWAAAALPIAALATLLHTAFLSLLPFLLVPAVLLVVRRRWLHLAAALALSALITSPFVLYEIENQWQDYPNIRYFSSLRTFVDLDAMRWTLAITTGWMLPNDGIIPPPERVLPRPLIDIMAAIGAATLVVGMLLASGRILRSRLLAWEPGRVRHVALVLWFVLPVLLNVRHWQPLFLHYFFGSLPAGFLLMALPCARPRTAWPAPLRATGVAALCAVAAISAFQAAFTLGGISYQSVRPGTDPCFMTPLVTMRGIADEVARLGGAVDSRHAVLELDTLPAKPMAYLVRDRFPHVYLPATKVPSETPTLVGDIGLGAAATRQAQGQASAPATTVLTATMQPEIRFSNGVMLHGAIFTPESTIDQQLILAITWSVDPTLLSGSVVKWQLHLTDSSGRAVASDAGDSRTTSDLRAERLVSVFWFDPRRELAPADLAPGKYDLTLQLIDWAGATRQAIPFTDPSSAAADALIFPVTLVQHQRCALS